MQSLWPVLFLYKVIIILYGTHIGHRVIATGCSNTQELHMRVSLHCFKDLFQCWDGNVLRDGRTHINLQALVFNQILWSIHAQNYQRSKLIWVIKPHVLNYFPYSWPWCCWGWPQSDYCRCCESSPEFPPRWWSLVAHQGRSWMDLVSLHLQEKQQHGFQRLAQCQCYMVYLTEMYCHGLLFAYNWVGTSESFP